MSRLTTDEEIRAALENCASEPVRIPGAVQPFGVLLAVGVETGRISHASVNAPDLFGQPMEAILGASFAGVAGRDMAHALNNALGERSAAPRRRFLGLAPSLGGPCPAFAFVSGDHAVIEFEPSPLPAPNMFEALRDQAFLLDTIQGADSRAALFDATTKLLRQVTGFDRVMIYRFDAEWNGEIVSESRRVALETFLGLRFPSWDIPAQARQIMCEIPLRLIGDIEAEPTPILAEDGDAPPLDITFAQCRGVSPVHMRYLSNMGVRATMTLSIVVDGALWGIIAFHHKRPRVAAPDLRELLVGLNSAFALRLGALNERELLEKSRQVDALQANLREELGRKPDQAQALARCWPALKTILGADALVMQNKETLFTIGDPPADKVIGAVIALGAEAETDITRIDHLADALPDHQADLNGLAGALIARFGDDGMLIAFRRAIEREVAWAGAPDKEITRADGDLRLEPRGSFSVYLEKVRDRAAPFSDGDVYVMRQLWPLIDAAERSALLADITRQQKLMIDELNHRVRNILALVRAVSHQSRGDEDIESHAKAFEARISALSLAHDLGFGGAKDSVSVTEIFELETQPIVGDTGSRIAISGADVAIKADAAPIFSLIAHELVTNAVKYGALSSPQGRVDIEIRDLERGGARILWRERGGPGVTEPDRTGFGAALIRQAASYELGGGSELRFAPDGVEAEIALPPEIMSEKPPGEPAPPDAPQAAPIAEAPVRLLNGLALVVEDNFVIASDMRRILKSYGFGVVELAATVEDALDIIHIASPTVAIMDINLGRGETSAPVAADLHARGVPFMLLTGYGADAELRRNYPEAPVLTKPVDEAALLRALTGLMS